MKKDFSVIIPAFNEEILIEKSLLSIKNQNYPGNIESIVVDNNSTDNTRNIAKKYADKVLFYNGIQGASVSRNFGTKKAQGDYLVFLDADSSLSNNALIEAEKSLSEKYAGGRAKITPPEDYINAKIQTFILNFWARHLGPIYTPYIYTTQENFRKSNGWDESIELGEEIKFLRKISKFGPLAFDEKAYVETSPRRYQKEGYFLVTLKGILGYIGFNMQWDPIRNK